jgi:hypothetical protein
MKTVNDVIERMRKGDKLRWVSRSELANTPTEAMGDRRDLYIGNTRIYDSGLGGDVICDPRIREIPGNEKNDQPFIDYELV